MPSFQHAPKHRAAQDRPARTKANKKKIALFSSVAIAATGIAVSSGLLGSRGPNLDGAAVALSGSRPVSSLSAEELADREQSASRSSGVRGVTGDAVKQATLSDATGVTVRHTEDLSKADPQTVAKALMPQYGMDPSDFDCLNNIYMHESKWNIHADNPYSSAYGIPQALPGSKMASAGPDWENNAETQIRWGLGYIKSRYGTVCSAWSFKESHGWY